MNQNTPDPEKVEGVLLGLLLASTTLAMVVPYLPVGPSTALVAASVVSFVALGGYQWMQYNRSGQTEPAQTANVRGCPSCSSSTATELRGGVYRCADCGTVYVRVGKVNVAIGKDPRVAIEA